MHTVAFIHVRPISAGVGVVTSHWVVYTQMLNQANRVDAARSLIREPGDDSAARSAVRSTTSCVIWLHFLYKLPMQFNAG